MREFTVYDTSGRVTNLIGTDPECVELYLIDGRKYVEGLYSGDRYYFPEETLTERPTFTPAATPVSIPADGVSTVTISGFPADATLTISGPINETWAETETTTELTVDLPGSYKVRIENWPYQDAEVTFNAT